MSVFDVVGLAGSLRRGSLNQALLRAAAEIAPATLKISPLEIGDLPLYNADLDGNATPPVVARLRERVKRAHGLLVATPEYNHGVPGVLKNAIDWLSRPPRTSALDGKVAAIMGASTGMSGTARGQAQLRLAFVFTNTIVMPQPEIMVGRAQEKFDAEGHLTDEPTRQFLKAFLERFEVLIGKLA